MRGVRILVAVAALGVSAFTHSNKLFSVEFPEGWTTGAPGEDGTMQADAPSGGVFCRVNSIALASLKDVKQAEINQQHKAPFDNATWAGILSVDAAKIETLEGVSRTVDGHLVQSVTFKLAADVMGDAKMVRYTTHVMTGRMVNVACFSDPASFETWRPAFDKVLVSLKPL